MHLHYLQHVPFEDAAEIATWARDRGHRITCTRLYAGEPLPVQDQFDCLIVLGGTMNIYEHDRYPWLVLEKDCIRQSIANGKTVLGVCLGGQLIADVLGGPVTRNAHKEIGWHPVSLRADARQNPLFAGWPDHFYAFHWHGDTFKIPSEAVHIAASEGCANQAFLYGERVVGLQFHLEYSAETIRSMLANCSDELQAGGPYVHDAQTIQASFPILARTKSLLYSLLDALASSPGRGEAATVASASSAQ